MNSTLRESTAVWKVVASDMPIGLVVADGVRNGERHFEAVANALALLTGVRARRLPLLQKSG